MGARRREKARRERGREGRREESLPRGTEVKEEAHRSCCLAGFHRLNRSLLQDQEAGNGMMSHVHGALNHTFSICKGGGET